MKKFFFVVAGMFMSTFLLPSCANAQVKLFDGFESANMSTTNPEGFRWGGMNRTSLVTMNPNPYILYPTAGAGPAGLNWTAKDGSNSLRFHYRGCDNPGGSEDDYHWSEQRFSLGTAQRDLWVRFWFKVPENFIHTTSSCSQGINNKFFTMWQDTYSSGGAGATAFIGWWASSSNPGGSILTTGGWESDAGGGGHTGDSEGIDDSRRFITYPNDQGRWMQIVVNLKAESNGWIKVWRRWENESSFTLMAQTLDYYALPPPGGPDGWMYGYLIGYTNSAFPTDTDFLVDAFTVSDQSLLDISGTTYTVTPSAGANGIISPNTPQTINSGSNTTFTVTPNSGHTASVGGTCGGTLVGTTYTTNAITANCTVVASFTANPNPVACNTVTTANFSQSAYNAYGAPYDLFSSNAQLVDARCSSSDTHTINATIGKTSDTTRIVYTKGYYFDPGVNNWAQYTSDCTGTLNGDWCAGPTTATITDADLSTASSGTPAYFVGMVCSVQGGGWKCGCRDTNCTNFYWQIQGAGL